MRLFFMLFLFFSLTNVCNAQFIGIKIGFPTVTVTQVHSIPQGNNNIKDDSGNLIRDDSGNLIKG